MEVLLYFITLGVVVTSYVGCTFLYVQTNIFVHAYMYMNYISTYHVCMYISLYAYMYVCTYSLSVDSLYLGCIFTIALVCACLSI